MTIKNKYECDLCRAQIASYGIDFEHRKFIAPEKSGAHICDSCYTILRDAIKELEKRIEINA